ncbi:P-loop containing nucleoside triphosphate hydrolase superfamily protein [Abeliophyllum distichum]|uniref:P-loop containing nucleoside triphosphate hydrolase superfamily protein n=1 Tax=Abeliophyllum distichum TaxID=126358 RepID=A0ABD1PRJ7_9LAMI
MGEGSSRFSPLAVANFSTPIIVEFPLASSTFTNLLHLRQCLFFAPAVAAFFHLHKSHPPPPSSTSTKDARHKDIEAEEKWLENCGEDEEFFKRESKRLHRDLLRIAPVYIGVANSENKTQYQDWESVAGLQDVIRCMKEEVVRALIGSCAHGDKRMAYFTSKGVNCLGKYVGDVERKLRLLFQVADKSQPSIIFFDEIDGLAPCRSEQQDQTHISVVSTLLALMDGLKSRGSVIVIGATNHPDAVDQALRRLGRFDREIYFPLPSVKDREAILSLHTQKWPKPITGPLLKWVARRTVGFAGGDL